jgi:hypothetical protein
MPWVATLSAAGSPSMWQRGGAVSLAVSSGAWVLKYHSGRVGVPEVEGRSSLRILLNEGLQAGWQAKPSLHTGAQHD